jgi:hypothetical protein
MYANTAQEDARRRRTRNLDEDIRQAAHELAQMKGRRAMTANAVKRAEQRLAALEKLRDEKGEAVARKRRP